MTMKGVFSHINGNKYRWNFNDGIMHRKGTLFYANGDKLVGEFKDNGHIFLSIVISIKVILNKVNSKEKAHIFMQMVINMRALLKMIKDMIKSETSQIMHK